MLAGNRSPQTVQKCRSHFKNLSRWETRSTPHNQDPQIFTYQVPTYKMQSPPQGTHPSLQATPHCSTARSGEPGDITHLRVMTINFPSNSGGPQDPTDGLNQCFSNSLPWRKPLNNCSYPEERLPTKTEIQRRLLRGLRLLQYVPVAGQKFSRYFDAYL
jgi:hypothetical protein